MRHYDWLLAGVLAFAMAAPLPAASAQDEDTETATGDEADETDVIVIYGPGRRDRGMVAFQNGDYAQAEIEFELNLKCAERQRMLEEMAVEQSVSDALAAEGGAPSRTGGWGDDGGIRVFNTQQDSASYYRGNPRDPDDIPERTCENSAWQLYMIAMSQVQQGKYEEAKRNFYRVINTSREPYLFDAHFRIALLEILDGNYDKAEDRLKTLIVLQERCHRRDERCEFREEIDELVAYLEPALEQARAEAATG